MEHVVCANCGQDKTTVVLTKWGYCIVRCDNCGLAYVNPRAFAVEPDTYFEGAYLSTIEQPDGKLISGIKEIYAGILANLATHLRPGRLLDVGCAMGHFMVEACEAGWQVHGVECSQFAARYGRQRWGLAIQSVCDLQDARLPPSHFDACVLVEVIEHLPFPRATLAETFRLLKPGGVVLMTTPNFSSYDSLLLRENWVPIIPTGHLYYFDAASLTKLLEGIGYEAITDLTDPADLSHAIAKANSSPLGVDPAVIENVRLIADSDRLALCNGRDERLVMWAQKPFDSAATARASRKSSTPPPSLEGRLVRVPGATVEDQRVFLIEKRRKHWVTNAEWLAGRGLRLEDTIEIDREILSAIFEGAPVG
jgi:SAM-dependent methyltransferase